MTDEERADAAQTSADAEESGPPPTTSDLLRWCIGVLAGAAWQNLGLVPNPASKTVERNLDDARMAIDAVAALMDLIKPHLDERARREMDNLLADLRLNFVEQKSKQTA
jgi:hypothetical protein